MKLHVRGGIKYEMNGQIGALSCGCCNLGTEPESLALELTYQSTWTSCHALLFLRAQKLGEGAWRT